MHTALIVDIMASLSIRRSLDSLPTNFMIHFNAFDNELWTHLSLVQGANKCRKHLNIKPTSKYVLSYFDISITFDSTTEHGQVFALEGVKI